MIREMNNQRIAAIFDVDGTLITNATLERIFIKFLWRRGQLGWREFVRWLGAAIKVLMGKAVVGKIFVRGDARASSRPRLKAIKSYLQGKDSAGIRRLAQECFDTEIAPRLSQEAIDRLRWHQSAGHFVILLSGTLD